MNNKTTKQLAKAISIQALKMVHRANASHIGSCLSMADIVAVLYGSILRQDNKNPAWTERDRVIVSKGHACAIMYAVLAEVGYFDKAMLEEYGANGTTLQGHLSHHVPGVELSTGSLGHGLPVACGVAMAMKHADATTRVFSI